MLLSPGALGVPQSQDPASNSLVRLRTILTAWGQAFTRPVDAFPIDLFRVLVGLLSFVYFAHMLLQADDFSAPQGLIDHALALELFWYTRMGLLQPGLPPLVFHLIVIVACGAALALVVGYRVKLAAAVLYVIAVSTYRWNFLVIYVDDAIMHLVIGWMLLLPIGNALVLSDWLTDRRGAWARWRTARVPGTAVRCLEINLTLVYLVAGLWKWTSPMWREGTALYAALKLPIAFAPDFWQPEHLPWLKAGTYCALVLEPLLPLMFALPTHHPVKWSLFLGLVGFHLGIIATLKVPYANIACLAASVIPFRYELMGALRPFPYASKTRAAPRLAWSEKIAVVFVIYLTLAMAGEVTVVHWRSPAAKTGDTNPTVPSPEVASRAGFLGTQHNLLYLPLWVVGIAQSYRLFDWIDDRNFAIRYEVRENTANGEVRTVAPVELFPNSIRSTLLQSYLHGVTWGRAPADRVEELRQRCFQRFAARFCQRHPHTGQIEAYATLYRVTAHNLDLRDGRRDRLLAFTCQRGSAVLHYTRIGPGATSP